MTAEVLAEQWSLKNVLNMPESAAYDSVGEQIFVSNVNGYAKDNNGFVSRVSADGKQLDLEWLTGLHSPTGMVVRDGLLYIADYDALVIASIEESKILQRIAAPDDRPALNDVAIATDGQVFVSGSASSSIYTLEGNELLVWKHDPDRLKNANGLLVENGQLIHGGWEWSIFNLQSKKLIPEFPAPGAPIRDIDGITSDGCGGFIVTLIEDQRLWRVGRDGSSKPLSGKLINGIDIVRHEQRLFVPTVGGGLSVFKLSDNNCD